MNRRSMVLQRLTKMLIKFEKDNIHLNVVELEFE